MSNKDAEKEEMKD